MRVTEIDIMGKKYPMCFSARVMGAVEEKYGDMAGMADALTSGAGAIGANVWLLEQVLKAGERYTALIGEGSTPAPTMDTLLDCCDLTDLSGLTAKLFDCIIGSRAKSVTLESEPTKNVETTPAEQ